MFRLTVRDHIMVAHSLPHPAFGPAQQLHGATFVVEMAISRAELGPEAIVMDIGEANGLLRDALADLDYTNLDAHPELSGVLTTTEALARLVAERVAVKLPVGIYSQLEVTLREHPDAWASYTLDLL
ncbi:6-pyruvoyl trahydropterin synthase family protein [Georgenia thermotolerans]|uniref:6-carboxy-5,6,7,8-tetrahydropterin synthase n=1 Tax=Georgenia thermotolerans TaxID=527326 RepID=A0A7J5UKY6_9MICO|nr:6-carboxytetrahydropterin synthase [Georgenia thermotolerans]KAE8763048.1 6-carboxytetrahydropterin synthase [Georgenia thermotolerans]